LPQNGAKRKAVTWTSRAGSITVPHDVIQRNVVAVLKLLAKFD